MPRQCGSVHCVKYVCRSAVLHHLGFFSGLLYVSNISHGMWKTNKVCWLLIHWLFVGLFFFGVVRNIMLLYVVGIALLTSWYLFTLFIWLHFLSENYDRHFDTLSAREHMEMHRRKTSLYNWGNTRVSKLSF